jgi:hypothetical protein
MCRRCRTLTQFLCARAVTRPAKSGQMTECGHPGRGSDRVFLVVLRRQLAGLCGEEREAAESEHGHGQEDSRYTANVAAGEDPEDHQ